MLEKFSVTNFKNFNKKLTLDFGASDYEFNPQSIKDGIVKKLQEINIQVVFTTHNTDIMTNDLLRPDCYFILDNNNVTALNKLTDQELRKAHNLQKLYKANAFSE